MPTYAVIHHIFLDQIVGEPLTPIQRIICLTGDPRLVGIDSVARSLTMSVLNREVDFLAQDKVELMQEFTKTIELPAQIRKVVLKSVSRTVVITEMETC